MTGIAVCAFSSVRSQHRLLQAVRFLAEPFAVRPDDGNRVQLRLVHPEAVLRRRLVNLAVNLTAVAFHIPDAVENTCLRRPA